MSAPQPAAGSPRKVLLDCDPGIDDALAIAFACGHPDLDLCAVTTVAGNVGLAQATANALSVLELVGRPDVPLAEGSAAPLLRPHVDARDVHGDSGLGQARLPPAQARPVDVDATDLIIDTIGAAPGEITLVATGPLTNIALAVRRRPELVNQVTDFVIMGGSATRGNTTPAAEFNIATDPEAAAIVFGAGWQGGGGHDRHGVGGPARGAHRARRPLHRGARIRGRGDRRVGPRPRRTADWMTPSPGAAMAAYGPPGGCSPPTPCWAGSRWT